MLKCFACWLMDPDTYLDTRNWVRIGIREAQKTYGSESGTLLWSKDLFLGSGGWVPGTSTVNYSTYLWRFTCECVFFLTRMARMMRGEEPFIYDKKVLEEVCWQHPQTYLHISAMDEMSTGTPCYCNLVSRAKHGTGHRVHQWTTNSCVFIFRFVLRTLTSISPL